MQVTFSLTRADVFRANWQLFWPRRGNLIFVCALIYFFYQTITHVKAMTPAYIASSFFTSVLGATALALLIFVISIAFALFRSSAAAGTLGEHRYELVEQGLREVTAATDAIHRWEGIKTI